MSFGNNWLRNRKYRLSYNYLCSSSQYLPDGWDDYVDHDNILETIIAQEQTARAQRRENGTITRHNAIVRNPLK